MNKLTMARNEMQQALDARNDAAQRIADARAKIPELESEISQIETDREAEFQRRALLLVEGKAAPKTLLPDSAELRSELETLKSVIAAVAPTETALQDDLQKTQRRVAKVEGEILDEHLKQNGVIWWPTPMKRNCRDFQDVTVGELIDLYSIAKDRGFRADFAKFLGSIMWHDVETNRDAEQAVLNACLEGDAA